MINKAVDGNLVPIQAQFLFELNSHICTNKPDLIILNETWLKKSVKNNEVIENSVYQVFRKDRSILSHPLDPNNPRKFKKNGGGVLIAIRSDIEAIVKRINLRNGAEIVAIEVTLDGTKFIFCTCYRVGTLGAVNHSSIVNSITPFFKSKRPKKIFIIGDFNLSNIPWPIDSSIPISSSTEKMFVDTFRDLGLTQCVSEPTHTKGKTLDILLTNSEQLVTNLSVKDHNSICKSDHFAIAFDVKTKVKRKKSIKRKIYNFKKANWEALNNDICHTNWDAMLDSTEPELAWSKFKSKLFFYIDLNISLN